MEGIHTTDATTTADHSTAGYMALDGAVDIIDIGEEMAAE